MTNILVGAGKGELRAEPSSATDGRMFVNNGDAMAMVKPYSVFRVVGNFGPILHVDPGGPDFVVSGPGVPLEHFPAPHPFAEIPPPKLHRAWGDPVGGGTRLGGGFD